MRFVSLLHPAKHIQDDADPRQQSTPFPKIARVAICTLLAASLTVAGAPSALAQNDATQQAASKSEGATESHSGQSQQMPASESESEPEPGPSSPPSRKTTLPPPLAMPRLVRSKAIPKPTSPLARVSLLPPPKTPPRQTTAPRDPPPPKPPQTAKPLLSTLTPSVSANRRTRKPKRKRTRTSPKPKRKRGRGKSPTGINSLQQSTRRINLESPPPLTS